MDPRKFACVCVCAGAWVCVLWLADARARRCHLAQTPYRSMVRSDSLRMGAVGTSKGSQDLHKLS